MFWRSRKCQLLVLLLMVNVEFSSFRLSHSSSSFYIWHSCLGRVSSFCLNFFASTRPLGKLQTHNVFDCSGCKLTKFLSLPFNQSVFLSSSPFDMIHYV